MYNCRLTLDVDGVLMESNESNNQEIGTPFFIQNEDELWANDVDRDGFNTTDSGDGILDDCPTTYGDSSIDRVGCADLDADGVSNLNDLWPFDPSQSLDTDGDSYGNNPEGIDGDACPEIPGIANGDGGDGCPPIDTDADDDGVDDLVDQCPETPEGTPVGPDGCKVEDEQNNTDDGNTTLPDNETLGNDGTDDGSDDTTSNEDGGDATDEGAQSNSEIFGIGIVTIGIIAGALIILLLSLVFIVRGRGSSSEDKLFEQQQMAYASITGLPAATADPTITPEQLAYELQLTTAGYPAEYARTYADQHFRPWLKA